MSGGSRTSAAIADAAVAAAAAAAAERQHTTTRSQTVAAEIVATLASGILGLHRTIDDIDRQIDERFRQHQHAKVLISLPGFGPKLAAEFLAATGGDMTAFDGPDRLAGVAGLAPAPKDSGRISGNHHRPRRYDRRLLRVCYLSAQTAARYCPTSRAYNERKLRSSNF